MSRENVEIVKQGVDAFNRRDVETLAALLTPDCEWFPALPGTVESGGYRGRAGIETYLAEIRDTWETLRVLYDEFRDLGDHVLALGRTEGRGRASGVRVESPFATVFNFSGGKMSRVRAYLDHGEASRAAGLEE